MIDQFCSNCIDYCINDSSLNLICFYGKTDLVSEIKLDEQGNDRLLFAPAGNFPLSPTVTVCGLATSYYALGEIIKKSKSGVSLEQSCAEAVYSGKMATNLALLLKALGIHTLLDENITLCIDEREMLLSDLDVTSFGKSGFFKRIPQDLHLTQSTCCWHEKGRSRFKTIWWDKSDECRSKGYFHNLVRRFLSSDSSRVFILLGINNQNLRIVEDMIAELDLSAKVGVFSPGDSLGNTSCIGRDLRKIVFTIHHPANTGFMYNNYRSSSMSLLYSCYVHDSWEFSPSKYGEKTTQRCMRKSLEYYSFLANILKDIRALNPKSA